MIAYLVNHFRYNTMNSWNGSTSYAANVKVQKLTFPNNEVRNRAYDLIQTDDAYEDVRYIMRRFDKDHDYEWQVGFNGRSGGYIVLYQGGRKKSEHKSVCTSCGQRNFKSVLPPAVTKEDRLKHYMATHNFWTTAVTNEQSEVKTIGLSEDEVTQLINRWRSTGELKWVSSSNVCGACNKPTRVNREFMETFTHPGKSTDMGEDFAEWDMYSLKQRVKLVMEFDRMVEQCIKAFVDFCTNHEAVEETYHVPKTHLVAKEIS